MGEERTPADDYRDARAAYMTAGIRLRSLEEQLNDASNDTSAIYKRLNDAERRLLDWVANDD